MARQSKPDWRVVPLALLAFGVAALIAWAIRDRASYLDTGARSLLPQTVSGGHHGGSGGPSRPPPITRERLVNYVGIAMLAAHATLAGVLISATVTRRLSRRIRLSQRIGAPLTFATGCAVCAALATVPVALGSVGAAISLRNSVSAAVTVLQYAFVLALIATILIDLRLAPAPVPKR